MKLSRGSTIEAENDLEVVSWKKMLVLTKNKSKRRNFGKYKLKLQIIGFRKGIQILIV